MFTKNHLQRFRWLAAMSWRDCYTMYCSWWNRDSVWWGVSVSGHTLALVFLALLFVSFGRTSAGKLSVAESFDDRALEAADGGVAIATDLPVTEAGDGGLETLEATSLGTEMDPSLDAEASGGGMFESTDLPLYGGLGGFDVSAPQPGPAIDGPGGVGAGIGAGLTPGHGGDGQGLGGGGSRFFGITGKGRTFVYVLDASESMLNEERFERAKSELLESVGRLSPQQRFFVILFNDNALPMDSDAPVPATAEEVSRLREWLDDVDPATGTNPLPALLYGLGMNPDAVYFLSDGEFDPNAIYELRAKNRGGGPRGKAVPIHTISLGNPGSENLMKIISRTSGGKYRFVK